MPFEIDLTSPKTVMDYRYYFVSDRLFEPVLPQIKEVTEIGTITFTGQETCHEQDN